MRVNKHWKDAVYSICLACLKEEPPGGADCLIFVNETHVDQLLCWHSENLFCTLDNSVKEPGRAPFILFSLLH